MDPGPLPTIVQRPTRVRYGVLLFACSLSMITYLDRACFGTVAGTIQHDFDLSEGQKGLLFFAFNFAYAVFEIPGGWLGSIFGARKTLIRIVIWWSCFTALTGFIYPNDSWPWLAFAMLFLVRFLFGMGEAGAYPNIAYAFHNWFPFDERGLAKGAVWMAGRFAGGITPLIVFALLFETGADGGNRIVEVPATSIASTVGNLGTPVGQGPLQAASNKVARTNVVHWRHTFWIFGCVGMLWCMAFTYWFRDRPEQKAGVNAAEIALIKGVGEKIGTGEPSPVHPSSPSPALPSRPRVPWARLFGSRNLWALCLMYFMGAYPWYFNMTFFPGYLKHYHGVGYTEKWSWDFWRASLMCGMPLLLGSVACLVGGMMSDLFIRTTGNRKWGRRLFGVVGMGLGSLCYFGSMFINSGSWATDSAWAIVWAVSLAAFCNDLTMGAAWASCLDIGGKYSGIVAGCMNSIGNLGGAAAMLVIAWVLSMFTSGQIKDTPEFWNAARPGWTVNYLIFGIAYVLGAILWLFFDSTKRVDE